ncbi:Bzip transcription factor [Phytophthora palmivora]|uniref:Bzip transcription factor n=1 Tax=Phytophthora palmivora TaxID=4796 RepID=A0A2P4YVI0_9STRA|nr:Bzip transcription factor [Phytophthora palmivora]
MGELRGLLVLIGHLRLYSQLFGDPHLQLEQGTNEHLVRLLLGQRLVRGCSVYFLFDENSDRAVRLDLKIDFVNPLLEMLGNLKDVATGLQHFEF